MKTMKQKTGKLDPARLQAALDAPRPDPLDPKMVEIARDLFKREVAERYIKAQKAKRSSSKR